MFIKEEDSCGPCGRIPRGNIEVDIRTVGDERLKRALRMLGKPVITPGFFRMRKKVFLRINLLFQSCGHRNPAATGIPQEGEYL